MSDGKKLIAAILENGSTEVLRGLTVEKFVDDEVALYNFVRTHYRRYGQLPAIRTVEDEIGRLPRVDETVEYYVNRLHDRHLFVLLKDKFGGLRDALRDFDMDRAKESIAALRSDVRVSSPSDDLRNFREAGEEVLRQYDRVHADPGMSGIPTGWPQFDEATGGYQNGDLVTWVARMGVGKTFYLLKQAVHAWEMGYSVLIVTMEMTIEQITRRLIGMQAGINPNFIRRGELSDYAYRRIRGVIDTLQQADRFILYAGGFSKQVEDIELLVHEYSPDIIFIDGAYLLKPDTGKKAMSRLERVPEVYDALKKLTITSDRPIINTTQFSRQAGKRGKDGSLETISFTDAVGMHSSLVVSIKEGKPPFQTSRRTVEILKGREGEHGEYEMNYRFTPVDFTEVPNETVAQEATDIDWMN